MTKPPIVQTADAYGAGITLTLPTTPTAGNLILIAVGWQAWASLTAPSGLTQILDEEVTNLTGLRIYTAISDGSTNSWVFSDDAGKSNGGRVWEISGADTTVATPTAESAEGAAPGTGPAATVPEADTLAIMVGETHGGALTVATGWTLGTAPSNYSEGVQWATYDGATTAEQSINPEVAGGSAGDGKGYTAAVVMVQPSGATPPATAQAWRIKTADGWKPAAATIIT